MDAGKSSTTSPGSAAASRNTNAGRASTPTSAETSNASVSGAVSDRLSTNATSVAEMRQQQQAPRSGNSGQALLESQAAVASVRGATLEQSDELSPALNHPDFSEGLEPLSPAEREKFSSLYHHLSPDQSQAEQAQILAGGQEALVEVLNSGKLFDRDREGKSLLDNLDGMRTQKFASENGHQLDGRVATAELLTQIADPGSIRQGNRNTCAPTSIEYLQAREQPAEYARIVRGLTSQEGEVELANGETMQRDRFVLEDDGSKRSSVSRLYQSSAMEYINSGFDYRNDIDHHVFVFDQGNPDDPTDDVGMPDGQGLMGDEGQRLATALMGREFAYRNGPANDDRAGALVDQSHIVDGSHSWSEDIGQALERNGAVVAALNWNTGREGVGAHVLAVTGGDRQHVYLRNPWGADEQGQQGPARQVVERLPGGARADSGTIQMTWSEFEARLNSYYFEPAR